MKNRSWEVYALSDPRTEKVRYVGVTFRKKVRINEHVSRAVKGGRTYRDCWIRSLIAAGVRPTYNVLEVGSGEGWEARERFWIAKYRLTTKLTNHTDGGEGTPGCIPSLALRRKWSKMRAGVKYAPGRRSAMLGKRHSIEAREKIRIASTGRPHTAASKKKVSVARKGKPLSAEHREKLAAAKRGKKHTEEHNEKIRAAATGHKPVLCIETGKLFPSVKGAARILGVTQSSISQAIRKGCRCQGNHFRFA